MKKKRILALVLGLFMLTVPLLGCQTATQDDPAKDGALVRPGEVLADVAYEDIPESLRLALWTFAGKTSGPALADINKNTLYSPVSLYYALAMLEAGAAGETKTQLRAFLEAGGEDPGPALQALYALMTKEGEYNTEQIANALWIREDLVKEGEGGVKQSFLDSMSKYFYASAFAVDFQKEETPAIMSRWVEEETRGKIKPEIDTSDPTLLMILMNTLYFKDGWVEPFGEDEKSLGPFFAKNKTVDDVSYLTRSHTLLPLYKNDRYKAVSLALSSGQMTFVLPNEGLTPEELLKDTDFLPGLWTQYGETARVDLKIPVFEYKSKTDILEALESLGLADIVQDAPDFSAMMDRGASVSHISQEAFIALDEKGVEAAAYTEIGMVESAPQVPDEVQVFHLDRPFIFVISDQAGVPLFVGTIRNPK